MDNQILPYIFSCSRCSFVWIYITKGKKRLSKLPFYATRVWSSGIYRLLVCLILWTCLSNLRAGPLSFHAWVFYTLNLSTQNKPYAFGSWFIPDVLPSDVTVCVCVYVLILSVIATCLNFSCLIFSSILSNSFLLSFSVSPCPRLSQPFIPSVCSRTSLWVFPAHRETGGNMHIDRVCVC